MRRLKKLKETVGPLLFLAGMCFIFIYVFRNWHDLMQTFSRTNMVLFSVSVMVLLLYNFFVSMLFWRTLTRLGFAVTVGRVARTFLLSQAAKYVPGKIWMIVYQKSSFRNAIPIAPLTLANVYFIFLVFVLTFCIAITAYAFTIYHWLIVPAVVAGGGGFIALQRSTIFWRLCTRLTGIQSDWHLEHDFVRSQALLYPLIVGTYILAHYLLIKSLYDIGSDNAILVVATLALSWTISSLAVVIPSGIVLRELIFFGVTSFVAPDLDPLLIASIAVMSRFWLVTVDVLGVICAMIFFGLGKVDANE